MSRDEDTPEKAVSYGVTANHENEDAVGPDAVAWMAQHFARTFTVATVLARVPKGVDLVGLPGLSRALAAIGQKSRAVLRDLGRRDTVALTAIVLRKSGGPAIVTAIDGQTATVVDPSAGGLEQELPLRPVRKSVQRELLLVTPAADRGQSMLAPGAIRMTASKGHWFWAPVRSNWRNWAQIMVAALLLNLMSLALPLFVINVYDKVIPNLAHVTLWTLAIGVGIDLLLDLMLRTIRSNVLERINRRVDFKVAASLFQHAMQCVC